MWKCYHCKKPIAKNAKTCPHCGGTFNAYARGFMQSDARLDARYEREKSGATQHGCLGAAMAILAVGALLMLLAGVAVAATDNRDNPSVHSHAAEMASSPPAMIGLE